MIENLNKAYKKCLGGNVEQCNDFIEYLRFLTKRHFYNEMKCADYMKIIKKGCALGSGKCCTYLGDEYNSISVKEYGGSWKSKYGRNCSLKSQSEAFKYYRKSCELGESWGCQRYNEFEMDIAEIESRERDKTHKSDITVKVK